MSFYSAAEQFFWQAGWLWIYGFVFFAATAAVLAYAKDGLATLAVGVAGCMGAAAVLAEAHVGLSWALLLISVGGFLSLGAMFLVSRLLHQSPTLTAAENSSGAVAIESRAPWTTLAHFHALAVGFIPAIVGAVTMQIVTTFALQRPLIVSAPSITISEQKAELPSTPDPWSFPWASGEPVYNAIASPNGGEPDILLSGVPTRIFFNIGPRAEGSLITEPTISEALRERMLTEAAFDLTVTMTCHVCNDTIPQTKPIRYNSKRGRSTVASFNIIPDFFRADARKATEISFSIDASGVEFDFLKVPVRVALDRNTPVTKREEARECGVGGTTLQEPQSDLIIRLAPGNDALYASFEPLDSELKKRLAAQVVTSDGLPKVFKTGAQSRDAATATAGETYLNLKALVEQSGFRQQLPGVGTLDQSAQFAFNEKSKKEAVQTLYRLGLNMYATLFYPNVADPQLIHILDAIEQYGSEKKDLRILIYDATYQPWQLLHAQAQDGAEPDPNGFWGNKYILGVIPTDPHRDCGRLPGAITLKSGSGVLYGHYWQTVPPAKATDAIDSQPEEPDVVSRLGHMYGARMSQTLGDAITVVRTSKDFQREMQAGRRDVALLWSFTHGHSGEAVITIDDKTIVAPEVAGQRLAFSRSDFVRARDIWDSTIDRNPLYFESRPFVFLNGCETGTQSARSSAQHSLPGVFLTRGARGVVVTESPVWDLFGYNFGLKLLEKMSAGAPAGEAMLATRREFLAGSNNPLGLLYSFYGNPAIRIVKAGT